MKTRSHSSVAAWVRTEKDEHPERFCEHHRCLWRVVTQRGPNPCRNHPHLNLTQEKSA